MLIDDQLLTREDDHWVVSSDLSDLPVPSSIQALLAARVEGLPADQWAIVTAASVEGTVFHRGAVSDLTPDSFEPTLELNLMDLVRRDVIRPDFADFPGDEAYRFRHALIRDAAYRSLSKGTSADLHERFAGWLERAAGERLREFEEIVGYHLEQAYRSRAAIGSIDTHVASLATRVGTTARVGGSKGARTQRPSRGDRPPRESGGPARSRRTETCGASPGTRGRADRGGTAGRRRACPCGGETAGRLRPRTTAPTRMRGPAAVPAAVTGRRRSTEEAARAVEDRGSGLRALWRRSRPVRARKLQAWMHWNVARADAAADAWEHAAAHARRAGDEEERSEILNWVASRCSSGRPRSEKGSAAASEIRAEVGGNLGAEAWTIRSLAGLHAMEGRFELARELLADGNAIFKELGQTLNSSASHLDAIVEMLAGDPAAAEAAPARGISCARGNGRQGVPARPPPRIWPRRVYAQGRDEDAGPLHRDQRGARLA